MKKLTRKELLKRIDEARRQYIRKRDYNFQGYAKCISCSVVSNNLQVGHYYSRVHDFTTELGGDERTVNLQCSPCNELRRGNPREYAIGLIAKYGKDILNELDKKKKTSKYWKMKELEELLKYYSR